MLGNFEKVLPGTEKAKIYIIGIHANFALAFGAESLLNIYAIPHIWFLTASFI